MKAAVVFDLNEGPIWADFTEPQPAAGYTLIDVRAAAISHVVKGRASGRHYSFDGTLPFVVGIDGVGMTSDGQRVYFAFPSAPFGSMAQRAPVALQNCLPLPDALDDISAAAMANPGMSAWAALVKRAQFQAGETVLINGATGSAGQLAVQIARYLGAKKIIATGRNTQALAALAADECIDLTADEQTLNAQFAAASAGQIDVVVDYLWGRSAELLLPMLAKYTPGDKPVRYVQVGSLAGADIALNGAVLRAAPLQLMGSGIGSLTMPQLLAATGEMLQAAVPGHFTIATTPLPLRNVAAAWPRDNSQKRTVFTLD
ncbi:TPA: zinc-binding alcohol dehydrogenase family protein [Klebsiella aerogenes]|uniref:quinone oxidoreductase family protein n=1 Tax=Klebsiella aerogenes TaxID=548 RepID=UPI001BCAA4E4|nr:zinc-binding alcohol dehydrogenase family protein [Klebsiella aerogenes]HDS2184441.1 zinc-binding alcohol dehydrogenase family protein [Klebsiella aerogenes]HDT0439027.1 zinc-binding alcohol dehydrogenase family protein [Klebsiella aerogenes]HDT4801523.1 zinc-binding alcohol dehydrogenase family protein [Klebsiella aerogenes]HDU4046710.1 zinc-binding alcohol dehydrogenase family protein [Klebsiella aerogenes]HDU5788281.1 zinc-binding alcohol dehydrogenase family protein [Klebsiella aerogene